MNNQETKKQELAVVYDIDGEQIRLTPSIVQQYIVGDGGKITLPEFKFFTELCKVRKLNPFLKEAYCIKFGSNPAQIVVGKDAVLKRAVLNPTFDGIESGIIVQNIQSGEIIERAGTFYLKETERLVGGWAKVYRKDWKDPTYCSVAFDEVAQRKSGGALNMNWATKGGTMVEKVAKVRALRETFVEDLGGMYEADELPRTSEDFPVEPEIIQQEEPEIISQPEPQDEPIDVTFDEL